MKTFIQILQLHAKKKKISYPPNLIKKDVKLPDVLAGSPTNTTEIFWTCIFTKDNNDELSYYDNCVQYQLLFFINSMAYFYEKPLREQISRKHLLMFQTVNNIFLNIQTKDHLRDIFEKAQRTYLALARFANLVRHKINKEKIDFDLRMEPIDIRSKYAIRLYHGNSVYFFVLTDLVNIIQTAITHSDDMFERALYPKNPYNNVVFTKTNLYNIYFRIKFSFINMPMWIELFYRSGFDIDIFRVENEHRLREEYAKHYVTNGSLICLYGELESMLVRYKRIFRNVNIHPEFPKRELVDIFRPYLFLYVMSIDFIHGSEKKYLSEIILKKKLQEFVAYNENFGRRKISMSYVAITISCPECNATTDASFNPFSLLNREIQRRCVTKVTFNEDHPVFTMRDAYESYDKKKIFKPSIPVPSERADISFNRNRSSDDEDSMSTEEAELDFLNQTLDGIIRAATNGDNDTDSAS